MPVEKQVAIIYAATNKYLLDISVEDILRFEEKLLEHIEMKYPAVFDNIRKTKELDAETEKLLIKAIEESKAEFVKVS